MAMRPVERGRKGVSPLIAAVLLIAFTMAVAAILTAWVTTFTQEQTQQLGNQSSQQIDCSFGQLDVFDTDSGGSGSSHWAAVAVTNTGTVDFNNTSVTALSGGSVLGTAYIGGFDSGQTKDANVSGMDSAADSLRIAPQKCPAVSVSTTVS